MPKKRPEFSPLPKLTAGQLEAMTASLAGDTRFQVFIQQLRDQRETAIMDMCNDAVVESHTKMAAAVGEVRTYNSILSLVDAHMPRSSLQIS